MDLETHLAAETEKLAQLPPSTATAQPSEEEVLIDETTKAQVLVKYLTDALSVAQLLRDVVPLACQLLGSKTASDVTEAIAFFLTASRFQVNNAIVGAAHVRLSLCARHVCRCTQDAGADVVQGRGHP